MRNKLDSRSISCVFLGVSEKSKGYMLFDLISKKVFVSRYVIFEEDIMVLGWKTNNTTFRMGWWWESIIGNVNGKNIHIENGEICDDVVG